MLSNTVRRACFLNRLHHCRSVW